MLIFSMKKEWYEKIKNGEKTIEYREVKPYWIKRIFNEIERKLIDIYPSCKKQLQFFSYQEFLELQKIGSVVFEPPDKFTLQGLFRLGYGAEKLFATITKIEIVNGKDTDLHIDKQVYAMHFYIKRFDL